MGKKTRYTYNEELFQETTNSNPGNKIEDLNYECQTEHLKMLLFVDNGVKPPYLQQQQNANWYKTRHKQGSEFF